MGGEEGEVGVRAEEMGVGLVEGAEGLVGEEEVEMGEGVGVEDGKAGADLVEGGEEEVVVGEQAGWVVEH